MHLYYEIDIYRVREITIHTGRRIGQRVVVVDMEMERSMNAR